MPRTTSALAVLLATAVLLVAAGDGAANRISSSNEQFRIVYSPLRFRARGGTEISCNATLEGTLINGGVLNKIFGGQYGFIIRADRSSCAIRFLTETLSWPIILTGFVGMLPNIAGINTRIEIFRFAWTGFFSDCLYESTSTSRQPLNWFLNAAGLLTSVEMSPAWIPSKTLGCEEIEVRGTGTATIRGGATQLTMTLI